METIKDLGLMMLINTLTDFAVVVQHLWPWDFSNPFDNSDALMSIEELTAKYGF